MPRSDENSPRHRRRKERHRSRDRSLSSSRDHRGSRTRDKHRRRDSRSKRRSISPGHKKSYDRSPTSYRSTSSHRSKRRSTSRHRSRSDNKKSRHRRARSSSSSSSVSSKSSVSSSRSKSRSRKISSSPEIQVPIEPVISKNITLESSSNEAKRRQLIEDIDADSFVPRTFTSSSKKMPEKVIIDLQKETISVSKVDNVKTNDDEIIHSNFLGNDDERMEKWVRKLFIYRQKYFDE